MSKTVVVTSELCTPSAGVPADEIVYTATVKDNLGNPLPESFMATLKINSTVVAEEQELLSAIYNRVTCLLTLSFVVPSVEPDEYSVALSWTQQEIGVPE